MPTAEARLEGDPGMRHLPLAVLAVAATALAAPGTDLRGLSEWLQPRQAPVPPAAVVVSELHWAAIEGDADEVRRLLASGASVSASETLWGQETPLHWAAFGGSRQAVRLLLDAGASVEAQDDYNETALHKALSADDPKYLALIELLLRGADPNAITGWGATPLHLAVSARAHAPAAIITLRRFGADPNARGGGGSGGMTPLHFAVFESTDLDVLEALDTTDVDPQGRELDVNARNDFGLRPLHVAVLRGDRFVLGWLLNRGANPDAGDDDGQTALDLAMVTHGPFSAVAELLRASTSVVPPPAPPPVPPPFRPQSIEVALGASGQNITLMTTEAGGYTLNGEAVSSGVTYSAINGDYTLTLSDGTWTATFAPVRVSVALGTSGHIITLATLEAGGYGLDGTAIDSGHKVTVAGTVYVLTYRNGAWTATPEP